MMDFMWTAEQSLQHRDAFDSSATQFLKERKLFNSPFNALVRSNLLGTEKI
jgi:hypothetical protein